MNVHFRTYEFHIMLQGRIVDVFISTMTGTIEESCESVRQRLIDSGEYDERIRVVWPKNQTVRNERGV